MQAGEPMSEEEVILSEPSSEAEAAPEEEEYDASHDQQAHQGHPNAAEEEEDEQEEQEPAAGVAAEAQGSAQSGPSAAAQPAEAQPAEAQPAEAQPAEAQPAEAQPAEAQPAAASSDVTAAPEEEAPAAEQSKEQSAEQPAEAAATSTTAEQPPAQAPAEAPATPAAPAAPAAVQGLPGLPARGLGLGGASLPAKRAPAASPPKADEQANGTQQQQQPATQQEQAATPAAEQPEQQQAPAAARPAGGLSGLGGAGLPKLPARPAKPAGGLSGLPARPGAASSSSTPGGSPAGGAAPSSSSGAAGSPQQAQQQQQQQRPPATTATPASTQGSTGQAPRATPSLPARPSGGLGSLPPRGTAPTAAGGAGARPGGGAAAGGGGAGAGGPPSRPALPSRPGGAAAAGAGGVRPGGAVVATGAGGAATVQAPVEVVDPDEPKDVQKQREKLQELRIGLLRAAVRFGMGYQSEVVGSYLAVLDRLEKISRPMAKRRVDVGRLALEEAQALDAESPPDSRLGLKVKVLVLGMTGTGKSALINALLDRQAGSTNAFRDATRRIRTHRGTVRGVDMTFIDTPGLHASNDQQLTNLALLRRIKGAYKRHKPNFIFYVDRLDAAKAGFGELTLLTQISEVLGQKVWRETMVVLTHANAAREQMGLEYGNVSKQRRNIMQNILRQASGEMQLRNPFHLVDTHPQGPRTTTGQPITYDSQGPGPLVPVPWKQQMYVQLLGLSVYEQAQQLLKEKAKPKAGTAAAANKQQDLFKQLMRSRLPPTSFFVEQMVEGVLKPDTWAVVEDPYDAETEDEEAEEFKHVYYRLLFDWAKRGNVWAQKEYAAMLRKLGRTRKAYGEAFDNEDIEMMASYGYEGYVAEGLDLGITFDPEDITDHRYVYLVPDMDWQIMPTLDYYGYEHEDAITGFVAEWSAQPFNVDGWGGIPVDLTVTVEKDKTTTCLQAESHASIIHSVKPFGNRHITQLGGAIELLRPNVKDVLYTLEANTFRDGLLQQDDHAGAGVMWARMGEGGKFRRGPTAIGYRVQEAMRLGPFDFEAVAAQVRGDVGVGVKDEGWGARAHVQSDWVPGLGVNLDWYRERTKDTDPFTMGGFATNFSYDWKMLDAACGCEVDWVSGSDIVHIDVNIFDGKSWKFGWLLLLPLANYLKEQFRRLRSGDEEEVVEEEEEEEEMEDAGAAGLGGAAGMLGGADGAAMLQQLLAQGGMRGMMPGMG